MKQVWRLLPVCVLLLFAFPAGAQNAPPAAQSGTPEFSIHHAVQQKLGPLPNLPACLTGAAERGDPFSGPSILLLRLTPNCRVPWHWHTANEELMIEAGTMRVGMKGEAKPVLLRGGDYIFLAAHHVHRAGCVGAAPCRFFLSLDKAFDIHYVDPAGNEIPASTALASVRHAAGKNPTRKQSSKK
jgi:Cupin domain